MNVGVTVWNGRISPVFDVARLVQVFAVENGRAACVREIELPGTDMQAQAAAGLGVDVLICGALSRTMAAALAAANMRVVSFVAGDAQAVLDAWLAGRLPDPRLSMPGCGCRRGRGRRCRGQGNGQGAGQGGRKR